MAELLKYYLLSFLLTLLIGMGVLYVANNRVKSIETSGDVGLSQTKESIPQVQAVQPEAPAANAISSTAPSQNEDTDIIAAAQAYLGTKGFPVASVVIEMGKRVQEFAWVTFGPSDPNQDMGKGLVVVQNINGTWTGVRNMATFGDPGFCEYPALFTDEDLKNDRGMERAYDCPQ